MNEVTTGNRMALSRRLRDAGLRPTIARLGVLQVLEAEMPRRLDVESVYRDLLMRGTELSQGTVYRALKDLVAHGMLLHEWRNGLSGGKAVYGLKPEGGSPGDARIVCEQCGCSTLIDDPALREQLRQLARRQGLNVAAQPMTVVAVCANCARNSRLFSGRTSGFSREASDAGHHVRPSKA